MKKTTAAIGFFLLCGAGLVWFTTPVLPFLRSHTPHHPFYFVPPSLIWTSVLTDLLVSLSYALILGGLLLIARRLRRFSEFRLYLWIFVSLACFILARGLTHLTDVLTIWTPSWYRLAAMVKLASAVVAIPMAILFVLRAPSLVRNFRRALKLQLELQRERDRAHLEIETHEAITAERVRAAKNLADAKERLEAVMDSTSDGILEVRRDWTVGYGNRAATGQLPALEMGKDLWDCFPGMRATEAERNLRHVMDERVTVEYESYYEPGDQWLKTRASPMEGGISIFFSDITLAKKLEGELEKERWLRDKRIQTMSHLAGGLAHEISNPLAIIHGRAADLQELANKSELVPSSDVLNASESILRTSDRAIRILRGLRGFGRDAAQDAMELASMYEVVDECVELQQARLERHNVRLKLTLPDDLPYILCRGVQIGQILTNLLNNAFDAALQTASGERWIALAASHGDHQIFIEVSDSGAGIAENLREHLMEPFFTTKGGNLGMGVGLSLSRGIAEEHGGTLILLAGSGHTCFRLSLPIDGMTKQA